LPACSRLNAAACADELGTEASLPDQSVGPFAGTTLL
jgi:hypothetical protein